MGKKIVTLFFIFLIFPIGALTISRNAKPFWNAVWEGGLLFIYNKTSFKDYTNNVKAVTESTISNTIPFITLNSRIASAVSTILKGKFSIESNQVLLGKDKWLFYKTKADGDPIDDYKRETLFSDEKMLAVKNNLLNMQKKCLEIGAELIIIIPPNKEQVYSKYMPVNIIRKSDTSKTDILIGYLTKNTDLKIVNPKRELILESEKYETYYKYDSHWNTLGSFIGVQQVMEALYGSRKYLNEVEISQSKTNKYADLSRMIGRQKSMSEDNMFSIKDYNDGVLKEERVLLVGDSFMPFMMEHLEINFKDIHNVNRIEYKPFIMGDFNPTVVILQFVERYSSQLENFSLF